MIKRTLATSILVLSLVFVSLPVAAHGQTGQAINTAAAAVSTYEKAVTAIETKVEARRAELGIPGMSLVIVKDDEIIYMKGLGYKDFEKKVSVTPDTQFAIGSATKAFTALTVLMSQDEGKLSLDDSPKKFLPYFKMYDAETDKNITVRDLLSHSSGLNRTDLAMITGKLNRAELIQVAAQAKPTAKLREKFQYQNIMYTAAGEVVAQAQKTTWEQFVPERIFKPLGMTNSTMLISQMEKSKDHSFGYDYNFDTKETKRRPFRTIDQVAPAGSINSSARDMAQWLRFVLSGGMANGKRLVSEKSFEEWLKPQMKMNPAGTANYGLGWFLQKWNGLTVVQHGGNIDGFNALVAMIPEKKLGFVMLTNVSGSSLGNELMPIVWENILGKPEPPKPAAAGPEKEAGKYRMVEGAFDIEIQWRDGKLVAVVPGQPVYTLENVGGRRYKLNGAPDGFFMTIRDKEVYLEQPHGNYTLPRVIVSAEPDIAALKAMVGIYTGPNGGTVEIKEADGKFTFVLPGQPAYTITEESKDKYQLAPLPDSYWLTPKRDAAGKLIAVAVTQPEGTYEFKRNDGSSKPAITVAELHQKALAAIGGEAALRKITTRVTEAENDAEHQGVKGFVTSWSKAPNRSASQTTFTALGKEIATGWEYFDGTSGEGWFSFSPTERYTGKRLDDVRLSSDFYAPLDWTTNYKKVEVTGTGKAAGQDAYIVSFEPKAGTPFKQFYSTTTFLLLRHEGVIPSSTSSIQIPYTVTYSDYREVDGIKIAHKWETFSPSNGNVVVTLKSIKHNVPIDDKLFAAKKP